MRTIYTSPDSDAISYPSSVLPASLFPKIPIGIALDRGSPSTYWGSSGATSTSTYDGTTSSSSMTKECYGLGTCGGLEGHWICSK